ncbi:PREDICTED: F-box/LRR-repeat protein 13-like isoform X1 [Poecilia mexicana]|uniref:F-box/LRR-repeat protein 13-like isoform X1 n=1 Tax=Poecilia mexicana TaxID=48701 RepID=UPI00072EBA62|nr:PREDICTED: F-box/LRR-repeat protein 13-like isoform X1 [Poecilia mexicana]
MAAADTDRSLKMSEIKQCLPQMSKALLSAACLICPNEPVEFLQRVLIAFQGHDNLQTVDWQEFIDYVNEFITKDSLKFKAVDASSQSAQMELYCQMDKAVSCYVRHLLGACFRAWKKFIQQRKEEAIETAVQMEVAKTHAKKRCQNAVFTGWLNFVRSLKTRRADFIMKLQSLMDKIYIKRYITSWHIIAMDAKRQREYFKKLEANVKEFDGKSQQPSQVALPEKRIDGIAELPHHLSLKIFQYLGLRDWLNCSEVSNTWKSIIHSGTLWSQINFSVGRDWVTDATVQKILKSYRPFVTHLNMRGCQSTKWSSLKYISECRNLQELNLSECLAITDMMIQRITEGCPCLLYLNLSYTLITNQSLRAIISNCLSLQYLGLAHCCRFTDEGFLTLVTEEGGRNLMHLDLSACVQMTPKGFEYISAGCPSLKEVVMNDMPSLSDTCVLGLLARCCSLSSISLLGCPLLSDIALKIIAKVSDLKSFGIEGNNQVTEVSWEALCGLSTALSKLHVVDCPGMTDEGMKYVSSLRHLNYLDISLCSRVSDLGIKYLTEGSSANKLQHLSISQCGLITEFSIKRITRRLQKLFHLNLSYCEKVMDQALDYLNGSSIQSLDLTGCNIRDQGLGSLKKIQLKKIIVAKCVFVTDMGIEKLCDNMRDLEHIDISQCPALTDAAINAISLYCRSLLRLKMAACPQVQFASAYRMTDMAIVYLTTGCQYLLELDMSDCRLLTDRSLKNLRKISPPLNTIRINNCTGISWEAAVKLQKRVSHWEYSSDRPSTWFDCNAHKFTMAPKDNDAWMRERDLCA